MSYQSPITPKYADAIGRSVAISETHYRLSGLLFVKLRERGIFHAVTLAGCIAQIVRGSRRPCISGDRVFEVAASTTLSSKVAMMQVQGACRWCCP